MCVIIYGIISAWITVHNNKINKQDEIWINRKLEQRNKIIQEIEDTRGKKLTNLINKTLIYGIFNIIKVTKDYPVCKENSYGNCL